MRVEEVRRPRFSTGRARTTVPPLPVWTVVKARWPPQRHGEVFSPTPTRHMSRESLMSGEAIATGLVAGELFFDEGQANRLRFAVCIVALAARKVVTESCLGCALSSGYSDTRSWSLITLNDGARLSSPWVLSCASEVLCVHSKTVGGPVCRGGSVSKWMHWKGAARPVLSTAERIDAGYRCVLTTRCFG